MAINERELWPILGTEPKETIIIDDPQHRLIRKNGMVEHGVTTMKAGHLAKNINTVYSNGLDLASANYGSTSEENTLKAIEIIRTSQYFSGNYGNKETAHGEDTPCHYYDLYKGVKFWARCDNKTFAVNAKLKCAANGLVDAVGDPDGAAIDMSAFTLKVLKAIAGANWVAVEFEDKNSFDNTA